MLTTNLQHWKEGRKACCATVLMAATLLIVLLGSCQADRGNDATVRSVYYWSTTLRMDSVKQGFLAEHDIRRMYLRYFDVVWDAERGAQPNATLRFDDAVPQGVEVVPTVFILNECMQHECGDLAEKLVQRIVQMNDTHDVTGVDEVQIDCDWTPSTEQRFFAFLTDVRQRLKEHGMRLSATIRLHQLAGRVPPVDRGVLMMYNTGDFTRLDDEHPILDLHVAAPYLRHLPDYDLPMSAAYPLFRWQLVFRGSQFVGILHGDDLPLLPTDSVVVREPTLDEILETRRALSDIRPDVNDEVILYELNNYNITRFNSHDYETILSD